MKLQALIETLRDCVSVKGYGLVGIREKESK